MGNYDTDIIEMCLVLKKTFVWYFGGILWYKYLIVSLVFSHLGFWSGNLFLIAPFPALCLLVPSDKTGRQ